MESIFVSYRRQDCGYTVDRIKQIAERSYGCGDSIFVDVNNIPLGVDFYDYIQERVRNSDVQLVLMGPNWLGASGENRLDDPNDFVRLEIEAALEIGIRVVPVLLDGADIPNEDDLPDALRAIVRRQAVKLGRARFEEDVMDLFQKLGFSKIARDTQYIESEIKHTVDEIDLDLVFHNKQFNLKGKESGLNGYRVRFYSDGHLHWNHDNYVDRLTSSAKDREWHWVGNEIHFEILASEGIYRAKIVGDQIIGINCRIRAR